MWKCTPSGILIKRCLILHFQLDYTTPYAIFITKYTTKWQAYSMYIRTLLIGFGITCIILIAFMVSAISGQVEYSLMTSSMSCWSSVLSSNMLLTGYTVCVANISAALHMCCTVRALIAGDRTVQTMTTL